MDSGLVKDGDTKNGNHFLKLLKAETARLNALVHATEHELETDDTIPEEVKGKLRVGAGKAKMLLRKKFIQFESLCLKNLGADSNIRYPVYFEDLAGLWDTITLQTLQVYKIFEEVDDLRKNNWEDPTNPTAPTEKLLSTKLDGDNTLRKTELHSPIA